MEPAGLAGGNGSGHGKGDQTLELLRRLQYCEYTGYMFGHSHDLTEVLVCESVSHSVVPNSLRPHGL